MNKGLILEIKEKEVIVLTKDGSFLTVKKSLAQGLDIGEEITFPRSTGLFKQTFPKKWLLPVIAAACFMLVLSALIGNFFLFSDEPVYAYVHVDINPSLEIGLNKQLEVVNVTGLNKNGEALLLFYEYRPGQKLDEVTIKLLELAAEQGYFAENNDVLISTSLIEEQEEYVQAIDLALEQVDTYLHQGVSSVVAQEASSNQSITSGQQGVFEVNSENIVDTSVQPAQSVAKRNIAIHRLQTDAEVRAEAKEKGISPGKYTLYLQAKENGIVTEVEEIKDKSVSELARELGGLGSLRSNSGNPHPKHNQDKDNNTQKDKSTPEDNKNNNKNNNNGKKDRSQQDDKNENKLDSKHGNKQDNREKQTPPGLEKKKEKEKEKEKEIEKEEDKRDPQGKREILPPNQSNNQGLPPGQAKKQGEDRLPPGQAKKKEEGTPPAEKEKNHGERSPE